MFFHCNQLVPTTVNFAQLPAVGRESWWKFPFRNFGTRRCCWRMMTTNMAMKTINLNVGQGLNARVPIGWMSLVVDAQDSLRPLHSEDGPQQLLSRDFERAGSYH